MASEKEDELVVRLLEKIDEKQDAQSEHLTALRIDVSEQKAAFEAHLKQDEVMYRKISDMDEKLGEYNKHLAVHIAGVQELRKINQTLKEEFLSSNKNIEDRLEKVEEPGKLLTIIKKVVVKIGEISIAIAAIYGLIKIFIK
jgi:flagellar motor switch protein FliM